MSCLICGSNACTSSFHSLEEQDEWDEAHDPCLKKIERLQAEIDTLKEQLAERSHSD